jgi:PKD repeat protein
MKFLITVLLLLPAIWNGQAVFPGFAGNAWAGLVSAERDAGMLKDQNFFVTTGREATVSTGDRFGRFVFYLEVDQSFQDRLFVRIFDADLGGRVDVFHPGSKVLYRIFGKGGINRKLRHINDPVPAVSPLLSLEVGKSSFYDNQWRTIAVLDPADGEIEGNRHLFQVVVDGVSGWGNNMFQVFVSSQDSFNRAVPGLRLYTMVANLRLPAASQMRTQVPFIIPEQAKSLVISNFDIDSVSYNAHTHFSSSKRPAVKLTGSKNKVTRSTELKLLPNEKGPAAVLFSSARANFVQLWIDDDQGRPVPIELPVLLAPVNHLPRIKVIQQSQEDCTTMLLDASASSDRDGDALSFFWRFNDTDTAEGSQVRHDFKAPGSYECMVTAQDDSGFIANSSSLAVPVLINATPIARIAAPFAAAVNEEVVFDGRGSTDSDGKIIRYRWQIDQGRKKSGSVLRHRFSKPGTYQVSLEVKDNGKGLCTKDQIDQQIHINAPPKPDFTVKKVLARGEQTLLDGGSSTDSDGAITAWNWDFGDGQSGSGMTVEHGWQEPGTFTVKLEVRDDSRQKNDRAEKSLKVVVNAAPQPVLTSPLLVTGVGFPITFSGRDSTDSDGKITAYSWDFGDSTDGKGRDVSHAYAVPGLYTVRLTVTDDAGVADSSVSTEQVIRVNQPPVPDPGADRVVNSSLVEFDASASLDTDDEIIAYQWDFGDGSRGEGIRISHIYALPGTYQVQLQVTDASGSSSASQKAGFTLVVNQPPAADAGADRSIALNDTVQFDGGQSLDIDGSISSYSWQIEGTAYDGQQVAHRFSQPGRFEAVLTVVDNNSAQQRDVVVVTVNDSPVARIAPLARLEPGQEVVLDGSASTDRDGTIIAYEWDFGDGSQGSGRQIKHRYSASGRYRAVLTVRDNSGVSNDTAVAEQLIAVNYPPVANGGTDFHTCAQTLFFDASASSDPDQDTLSHSWDFGDNSSSNGVVVSHHFASQGIYPVTLTSDDNTGLANNRDSSTHTVAINAPPEAVIRINRQFFCAGEHVLFDGSASTDPEKGLLRYFWDLGDGQQIESANPIRVYDHGGDYTVRLTVLDDSGLSCNSGHDQKTIHIVDAPVARAGADIAVCANTMVSFDGSASTGGGRPIIGYEWNFGDSNSAVGAKTSHVYAEAGSYTARLTIQAVDSGECENSSTDEFKVEVTAAPLADFTVNDACPGDPVLFKAAGSGKGQAIKGLAYGWDYGDGTSGKGMTGKHSYGKPGLYEVGLRVTSKEKTACNSAESRQQIRINDRPTAEIRMSMEAEELDPGQPVLTGSLLQLAGDGSSDSDGVIKQYSWDFGDGSRGEGVFVSHRFTAAGVYPVRLTVEDDSGVACNRAETVLKITVVDYPDVHIVGPDRVCVQQPADYRLDNNSEAVNWDFGNKVVVTGRTLQKTFSEPGLYEVRAGFAGHPVPAMMVRAVQLPVLQLPESLQVIAGEELQVSYSLDRVTGVVPVLHWDMGDGSQSEEPVHTYTKPGSYTIRLTVTAKDDLPCLKSEYTVKVRVLPVPKLEIVYDPAQPHSGGARDEVVFQTLFSEGQGNWLYNWNFGDKSQGRGAVVSHAFQQPGSYTVTLTLTDGSGISAQSYLFSRQVEVKKHRK